MRRRLSYARNRDDGAYLCATRYIGDSDIQCYGCGSPLVHERPNNGDAAYFRHIDDGGECTEDGIKAILARELLIERMSPTIRYLFKCDSCRHTKCLFTPDENDVVRCDYEWRDSERNDERIHAPDIVYTDVEETPRFVIEISATTTVITPPFKTHWAIVDASCIIAAFEANQCDILVKHCDATVCVSCEEVAQRDIESRKRIEEEIRRNTTMMTTTTTTTKTATKKTTTAAAATVVTKRPTTPFKAKPVQPQPPQTLATPENTQKRKAEVAESLQHAERKAHDLATTRAFHHRNEAENREFMRDSIKAHHARSTQFNEYERLILEARKRRKLAATNTS